MLFQSSNFQKSDYKESLEKNPTAIITTSMGAMTIELFAKDCPETVWNFINLAEGRQEVPNRSGKFFDGLTFHRIIEGFMIQGGCPLGTGTGGPGYRFKDECHSHLPHNQMGILSMANAGPGTNGSQFFITLSATPHLNGRHTVFGKVIEGMEILEKIGSVETDFQDRPKTPVVISSVEVIR